MKPLNYKTVAAMLVLISCHVLADVVAFADEKSSDGKLRIICFGAHPDDAEYKSGGTAALWASMGHHVKLVSVTNGDIGHWQMAGGPWRSDVLQNPLRSQSDLE